MKRSECIEMEELAREEKDEEAENTGHWGSLQTDGRAEEVCVRYLQEMMSFLSMVGLEVNERLKENNNNKKIGNT